MADASWVGSFRAMAYNNAWANHRLLTACLALSDTAFVAPRVGFFPSIAATLNHIYIVDWFYVDGLEAGWLGRAAFENRIPFPAATTLLGAQAEMDRRLIAVCDGLTEADLAGEARFNRGVRVQVERRDRVLLHLFQHQIHHRGQAHAMLSATSVEPPQLDEFYSTAEAPTRAGEFAALGFTEAMVWRG